MHGGVCKCVGEKTRHTDRRSIRCECICKHGYTIFPCFILSPLDSLRVYFPIATRLGIGEDARMCDDARGSYSHLGYIDRSITDQASDMHVLISG